MRSVLALAVLLVFAQAGWSESAAYGGQGRFLDEDEENYIMTYNGSVGSTYDDGNYSKASTSVYALDRMPEATAAHPNYSFVTSSGNLVMSGDNWNSGRGWASMHDKDANRKWVWQSDHNSFDATLGSAELSDGTIILGGVRDISGTWKLLLVAVDGSDGSEKWSTTFTLSSPNPPRSNGWSTIYWVDTDPDKELLIIGGVVDHQSGGATMVWKSGG